MRARPDLVGGPDGVDFLLMRDAPGWLAKVGAEGLLCAAGPDGLGVALKSEDGTSRPHAPALAAFLGVAVESLAEVLRNSRGEPVGAIGVPLDAARGGRSRRVQAECGMRVLLVRHCERAGHGRSGALQMPGLMHSVGLAFNSAGVPAAGPLDTSRALKRGGRGSKPSGPAWSRSTAAVSAEA